MFHLDQFLAQRQPQRLNVIAICAIAGCALCVMIGLASEFSADIGIADPPQLVASQDPFKAEEVNPTYSSTYDDGKVVYGTQTHAPGDHQASSQPAHTTFRDRIYENRAERRGWRAETPFMQRGPVRRCIAWFGTGVWRLVRPRGRFVRVLPAHSLRVHGFSLAMANA